MKKTLLYLIGLVLLIPMVVGIVDLMTWFYLDHQLTSIDWHANHEGRVCLALMSAAISVGPFGLASFE